MPVPYYPSAATLVRVRILRTNPKSSTTERDDSEHLVEALREATKPLLSAPGHTQSAWGRLKSDHDTYLLCSYWDDLHAADAFKSSPAAQILARTLTSLSTNPTHSPSAGVHVPTVTISTIDFTGGRLGPQAVLGAHTQIRHVYFPAPVPAATRAAVRRLPGLVYRFGMGISAQNPPLAGGREWPAYYRDPAVGWFVREDRLLGSGGGSDDDDDERSKTDVNQTKMTRWWGGRGCDEFVCILFWKDEERERKFLREQTVPVTVPGDEPGTSIWVRDMSLAEEWEGQLREAGAVGWEDEFVDFGVV